MSEGAADYYNSYLLIHLLSNDLYAERLIGPWIFKFIVAFQFQCFTACFSASFMFYHLSASQLSVCESKHLLRVLTHKRERGEGERWEGWRRGGEGSEGERGGERDAEGKER